MANVLSDMNIRKLSELNLGGKRVLLRADFNCPLDDGGVADDTRIRAALPTIRAIQKAGGRVVACSHLGRPKGKRVAALSLEPVATRLAELLDQDVLLPDDCVGEAAQHLIGNQRDNQVVLLENLRFHAGETADNEDFARRLSAHCDVFVNDAFGALHRAHASVSAVARLMPDRTAGLLIARELGFLHKLTGGAQAPYIAILGGAKIAGKIDVIERLLPHVNGLMIGGAMANTFLAAQGHAMGASKIEADKVQLAKHLVTRCAETGVNLWLPVDHIATRDIAGDEADTVTLGALAHDQMAVDIGPKTVELYAGVLDGSADDTMGAPKTIFWNGPMGIFERPPFATGTMALARALARSPATSVIGGGDSAAAVHAAGVQSMVSHVSTGGGATLEYLAGNVLPGLAALRGGRR